MAGGRKRQTFSKGALRAELREKPRADIAALIMPIASALAKERWAAAGLVRLSRHKRMGRAYRHGRLKRMPINERMPHRTTQKIQASEKKGHHPSVNAE
jgi:hypothetical protein